MTKQSSVRDAMVREYLADLEVALAGADPVERAETLASIREHLELAVPTSATVDQVRSALADLGAPAQIAQTATTASAPAEGKGVDGLSVLLLVGAALALVGIPLIILSFIVAFLCLVGAFVDLRTKRGTRPLTWAALLIAAFALIINPLSISFFYSLLSTSGV